MGRLRSSYFNFSTVFSVPIYRSVRETDTEHPERYPPSIEKIKAHKNPAHVMIPAQL